MGVGTGWGWFLPVQGDARPLVGGWGFLKEGAVFYQEIVREGGEGPETGFQDFRGPGFGGAVAVGQEDELGVAATGGIDADEHGGVDFETGFLDQFPAKGGGERLAVKGKAAGETPSLVLPETMLK